MKSDKERKEIKMMEAIIKFAEVMGMKIDIDDGDSSDKIKHIEIDYEKKIVKVK